MMKQRIAVKILLLCVLLAYGIKGYGQNQIVELENTTVIWLGSDDCHRLTDGMEMSLTITKTDNSITTRYLSDLRCNDSILLYIPGSFYSIKMRAVGSNFSHEKEYNVADLLLDPMSFDVYGDFGQTVLSGAVLPAPDEITDVCFMSYDNTSEASGRLGCSNQNIRVKFKDAKNVLARWVQCRSANGEWVFISPTNTGDRYADFSYSSFQNMFNPHEKIYFRTASYYTSYYTRSPGQPPFFILTSTYTYPAGTEPLSYLPSFQFPVGKNLIVETPNCSGENTTIKIPFEGNTNYTILIKEDVTGGQAVLNAEANSLSVVTGADGTTYYQYIGNIPSGDYVLTIENKEGEGTGCPFTDTITVPPIVSGAALELKNISYDNQTKDNADKIVQILQHGGTGSVSFIVFGSSTAAITVHVGNQTFPATLSTSSQVNGATFYEGNVTIHLPAGTYGDVYVSSATCNSNSVNLALAEPDTIAFSKAATMPDCNAANLVSGNASNGTITLSGISGGIGGYKYTINSGDAVSIAGVPVTISGFSGGSYEVSVRDDYGNVKTQTVTVDSPAALSLNITGVTPPASANSNNGQVTVVASGGTPPYSFSRTNSLATFDSGTTVGGYPSGDSAVYVKDANNCTCSFPVTIPNADQFYVVSKTETAPVCRGGSDGTCTLIIDNVKGVLSITGINAPYEITGHTITITGLSEGQNSFTLTDTKDGNAVSSTVSFTIPQAPAIQIAATVTPVSEPGEADGSISISLSDGTAPYQIALYDGGTKLQDDSGTGPFVFSGLAGASGNGKRYLIEVEDDKGCTNNAEVLVKEQTGPGGALQLLATLTKAISCDAGDATVTLSAQGGAGNYQYSADNVTWATNPVFSGLPAGTYTFYVKDSQNTTASTSITINNPVAINLTLDQLQSPLCRGESNGQIQLMVSGGTTPYTLSPAAGEVTQSVTGGNTFITVKKLAAGNYTFTVRDNQNCPSSSLQVTVTEPDTLKVTILGNAGILCDANNGSLTVQASGGKTPYTYALLSVDSSYSKMQAAGAGAPVSFTELPVGTYRITVTDSNSCSVQSALQTLQPYVKPAIDTVTVRNASCFGAADGQVKVTSVPGTAAIRTVTLYNDSYTRSNSAGIFENVPAGSYKIDVYDENGCKPSQSYPVTVRQPEGISITVDAIVPAAQKGVKEGKIVFRIKGGNVAGKTVYLKQSDGTVADQLSGINNYPLIFTVYAGEYYIEVQDQGCSATTGLVTVGESGANLGLIITEVRDALCKSQTGSIEVQGIGGWGNYRYKRGADQYFSTLSRFEKLFPGTYQITVIDQMGATCTREVMINEPQDSLKAEVTGTVAPTCGNNGHLSVYLSGGTPPYKLYHDNDTLYSERPATVTWPGLGGGTAVLHLTDANGCLFDLEAIVPDVSLRIDRFEAVYPSVPGASNASLAVVVSGGSAPYIYVWKKNFTINLPDNGSRLNNITAGYYRVEVREAGGCSAEGVFYLADPADLRFTVAELGHETAFHAANGYAVLRSEITLSAYEVIDPHHTITSYTVSNATTISLRNLEPGKYIVRGRNAAGDQVVAEFEILPYPEFVFVNTVVTPVSVAGGSDGKIQLEVQGGADGKRFTWTNEKGRTFTSADSDGSSILTGIPAGTYTVTVEDRYGNRYQTTVTVPEPDSSLKLNLLVQYNQSCRNYRDAYVILSASGGWGNYQYRHESETGYSSSPVFSELATGKHTFYVIDRLGIIASLEVQITEPEVLKVSVASIDSVTCKDAGDGRAVFNITGGTPPYFYKEPAIDIWMDGNEANGLPAGFHTFVFSDANRCGSPDTLRIYVPEPEPLSFTNIQLTHTTCSQDNGAASVSVQGGTKPYSYRWFDAGNQVISTNPSVSNLKQNGLYRLEVTDRNGCILQTEQRIQPSTVPRVLRIETTDVRCYDESNGTARVTQVEPGQPSAPYTLTWSNGNTGEYASGFPKGQHSVTVKDDNGCSSTCYFDIGQPDALNLRLSEIQGPHCFGFSDGYIRTETTGGTGGYTYRWSTGAVTPNIDNLPKGNYSVKVTDASGCTFEAAFSLSQPDSLTVDLGEDILICPGNTVVLDGQNYVSHRWFTDKGNISGERYLSVSESGHYFLEAINREGCSVWGDINVGIGKNALQADLLLASEAAVGDTLVIFELSNMTLDSLRWEFDTEAFERIAIADELYNLPYVLELKCLKTGIYNINLYAYSGGCYSPAAKQVEVVEASERRPDDLWGAKDPLIKSFKQYPNPTTGLFTVELELREAAEASLVLFSVASGVWVDQRSVQGSDSYRLDYNMQHLNTGVYVLMVTAANERKQTKIIIQR